MNRTKYESCPVCKSKLQSRSFEAPECPKCQTVFPNIFRQIQFELNRGSRINLSFIHHALLDETPLPAVVFQKLAENSTLEDLSFRRSRAQSNNVLSVEACKYIGQLLEHQKKLWHFAFDCPVEAAGLPYISHGLSVNQSLKEVDLSFSSVYEAEQLAKGVAASKAIKKVSVSGNLCPSEGVFKFLEVMQANQFLTEIKLENMQIGSDVLVGLKYLPASASLLLANIRISVATGAALDDLKGLKTSELKIVNSLNAASMALVLEGLAKNTFLKKLVISQKEGLISNAVAGNVADLLRRNYTLTELTIDSKEEFRFYNNNIKVDSSGFKLICKALETNRSLTSLDLGCSGISDNLCALGEALLVNRTLKTLNLSWNQFGNSDLTGFCEGLHMNPVLQSLNLSKCNLSGPGMQNLVRILRETKTLTDIDLNYHSQAFGYEMYPTLCDAIKVNKSLKKVVLGAYINYFHHNLEQMTLLSNIASIIKYNSTLTSLTVIDLCFHVAPACYPEFVDALKSNKTLTTLKLGHGVRRDEKEANEDLKAIFASNYWLLEADFYSNADICKYLKRNLYYRKRVIADTMVLCENIFRSQEAMDLLPPELWMNVFAQLCYPGIGSMAPVVEQFINYRNTDSNNS